MERHLPQLAYPGFPCLVLYFMDGQGQSLEYALLLSCYNDIWDVIDMSNGMSVQQTVEYDIYQ